MILPVRGTTAARHVGHIRR